MLCDRSIRNTKECPCAETPKGTTWAGGPEGPGGRLRIGSVARMSSSLRPDRRCGWDAAFNNGVPTAIGMGRPIDFDEIASDHIADLPFGLRKILSAMGAGKTSGGGNLASYLLFESGYTRALIDLGYHDAQSRKDELMDFVHGAPIDTPTGIMGWESLSKEYS
jgi:hypothetical protein